MRISIKISTGKTIADSFEAEDSDTVLSLKEKIKKREGISVETMRLIFQGQHLADDSTLSEYNITNYSILYLILKLGGAPQNVLWAPFIKKTTVAPSDKDVPILDPVLKVFFKKSGNKKINLKTLQDRTYNNSFFMQNQWHTYIAEIYGHEKAQSLFWTDVSFVERVILIELGREFYEKYDDDEGQILDHIEREKYHINGINSTYYGGDTRSWQRYSDEYPVSGSEMIDETEESVQFVPHGPLKHETWYALVLLHNNHMYEDAIYEDYLIPFKTAGPNIVYAKITL